MNIEPRIGANKNAIIGTSLVPEKNSNNFGICLSLKLLVIQAPVNPQVKPPNTDVCNDLTPRFVVTTDVGTSLKNAIS